MAFRSRLKNACIMFKNSMNYSTASTASLKSVMAEKVEMARSEVREIRKLHGNKVLDKCSVIQAYEGMRSFKAMTYETSLLDPEQGIRFRGYTIPECQQLLPKTPLGKEPLAESLLWLFLTGDIPTDEQVGLLCENIASRAKVRRSVLDVIDALPITMHPMSQLSAAVLALQQNSVMAAEYAKGKVQKSVYWEHFLEDTLTLIAQLPEIASYIYRRTFKDRVFIASDAENFDMSANFARMMGFDDPDFMEFLRLYLMIHSDHEGGSVSAHTIRLVGSTLSDPYLAFSAGLNGLAGPLHGGASQEMLRWILSLKRRLGSRTVSTKNLTQLLRETFKSGEVIPGFGHPILCQTDPRFTCLQKFARERLSDDELFQFVSTICDMVPTVLVEDGLVRKPWPNVDALSGVLLTHYGLTEASFYSVLFGVSRAIGPLANLVWDRALMLPIVHPVTVSTTWLKESFGQTCTKSGE